MSSQSQHPVFPQTKWVRLLLQGPLKQEIPEDVAESLFLYLADQGLFKETSNGEWEFAGVAEDRADGDIESLLELSLQSLGRNDPKSILPHFMAKATPREPSPAVEKPRYLSPARPSVAQGGTLSRRRASDLSNLQIVKKVGNQLKPFLEMEKEFFERVIGKRTSKEEAMKLFNYVLKSTKEKVEPQQWVQLSRRRHR